MTPSLQGIGVALLAMLVACHASVRFAHRDSGWYIDKFEVEPDGG